MSSQVERYLDEVMILLRLRIARKNRARDIASKDRTIAILRIPAFSSSVRLSEQYFNTAEFNPNPASTINKLV